MSHKQFEFYYDKKSNVKKLIPKSKDLVKKEDVPRKVGRFFVPKPKK